MRPGWLRRSCPTTGGRPPCGDTRCYSPSTCLYKWYKIPPGIQLNRRQQEKIVNLLMAWIQRQL